MEKVCVNCGQTRETIRLHKLFCATMSYSEAGSEVDQEFPRHRFKPFSEKELASFKKDEDEMIRQMGEFAEFVENQSQIPSL